MKICVICGNEIVGRRSDAKYCSKKCQTRQETMREVEKNRNEYYETATPRACEVCGTEFVPPIKGQHQKYCSVPCTRKAQEKIAVESGKKQEYRKTYLERHGDYKRSADLDYHNRTAFGGLKYDILKRDKYTCQHCGCDKVGRLIIHHIDEDKQHNEMSNLVTLCRGCHAKVHHSGMSNPKFKDISKEEVVRAIKESWNLEEAAKKLGITRKTLAKKREMYGLM